MRPQTLAPNDPGHVAHVVHVWCEQTTDSPTDGTRRLMAGTAAMAARAAAAGAVGRAQALGLRYVALERHLAYLEAGVRS